MIISELQAYYEPTHFSHDLNASCGLILHCSGSLIQKSPPARTACVVLKCWLCLLASLGPSRAPPHHSNPCHGNQPLKGMSLFDCHCVDPLCCSVVRGAYKTAVPDFQFTFLHLVSSPCSFHIWGTTFWPFITLLSLTGVAIQTWDG